MAEMPVIWLRVAATLYSLGLLHAILTLVRRREHLFRVALGAFGMGSVFHFVSIIEEGIVYHRCPIGNLYETLSMCAFLVVVVYLFVHWRYKVESLAVFIFPLVFVMVLVGGATLRYSFGPRFQSETIPALIVNEDVANQLLAVAGQSLSTTQELVRAHRADPSAPASAFDIATTVRISVSLTPVHDVDAMNVVGLLRAPDPNNTQRAVLIGGHLDGVGTDPDGSVFQAANDNASGPAVTIEVARALAAVRSSLNHSIVFVAFAGEEEGFYGSDAYVAQMATIPGRVESLVAVLNLEGLWTRYDDPESVLDEIATLEPDKATLRMQQIYAEPIKEELIGKRIREIKDSGKCRHRGGERARHGAVGACAGALGTEGAPLARRPFPCRRSRP